MQPSWVPICEHFLWPPISYEQAQVSIHPSVYLYSSEWSRSLFVLLKLWEHRAGTKRLRFHAQPTSGLSPRFKCSFSSRLRRVRLCVFFIPIPQIGWSKGVSYQSLSWYSNKLKQQQNAIGHGRAASRVILSKFNGIHLNTFINRWLHTRSINSRPLHKWNRQRSRHSLSLWFLFCCILELVNWLCFAIFPL